MSVILRGIPTISGVNAKGIADNVTYTTWDVSDTWNNASIDPTYSNDNLTAFAPGGGTGSSGQIRSAAGFNTGLRYAEITINSLTSGFMPIIGIVSSTFTTSTSVGTGSPFAWWGGGQPQLYGQISGIYGTGFWSIGNVIGVLVNSATNTLTFYRNGVSQGVATSGLPAGTYHIWANGAGTNAGATMTANFGETPFAYPVAGATGILA